MIRQTLGRARGYPGLKARYPGTTAGHEADCGHRQTESPAEILIREGGTIKGFEDHAAFEGIRTPVVGLEPAE